MLRDSENALEVGTGRYEASRSRETNGRGRRSRYLMGSSSARRGVSEVSGMVVDLRDFACFGGVSEGMRCRCEREIELKKLSMTRAGFFLE